jgi:CheY-like chemotaxis protein
VSPSEPPRPVSENGAIAVESRVGVGTTFSVLLPRREPDDEDAPEISPTDTPRGGSETILVVEDDGAVRATTALTLKRHGYDVVTAMDGAEALRTLAERDDIALVVTDLVMPGKVSGRALVEQLHAKHPATRVVITSGYSPEVFGHELDLKEGVNFVAKPVSVTTLLEIVRRSLDDG